MKLSQTKLIVPLLIMTSLGLVACNGGNRSGTELTSLEQLNQLQDQGLLQVMLPVQVRIDLAEGGTANHELLGFNPETRTLQLAGLSQGLSLSEVEKIERDRDQNQGEVLARRANIRGEDTLGTETWQVPLNALSSEEATMLIIRGEEAWDSQALQGKLQLQHNVEFVLDEIMPLSADEIQIVVSKVRRSGEE
jgi:hypothetical protein